MKNHFLFLFTLLCLPFCSCLSSINDTPIFPCSNKLEHPYGIIAHLTKEKSDYPYLAKEKESGGN